MYDTHKHIKNLMKAGAGEELAAAIVGAFNDRIDSHAVTKADLIELRGEIKAGLAELGLRIAMWNGSIIVVVIGVAVSVISKFS